ncbi:WxL protein peptidoglycan domain-containing protein [Microbispora sp. ATCC PTA-5024]|uniref:WxL protein peptidoglycan domain-containing protein n=1 Tax=Microbispora sp. ATCC PTA-5024 TaxID=316330 RepID=UPI0003DD1F88|nr:DUF916 domain-containing protein [Microbispora sp. ATCC PTA-5024]ETK35524.1 dihydroorotate oxidase [Microbispora sp. ATCC PTA-5024]
MHPSRPRTTTAALAQVAVAALLATLGLLVTGAGPAAADGDVTWTVRTASNDFGSDRENFSYTLDPGGRIEDALVVANNGAAPLHLAVYAADGFTTKDGRLDLVGRDVSSAKVGAWVHADRPDVTVPPGESAEVPFTLTLPDSAVPGEYMGGIVTVPAEAGHGDRRLGIRIRLRVGGELRPSVSVEDARVRYSGTSNPFGKGDATVTYTIRNTGNAILAARQAVSVSGPFSRLAVRAGRIGDSPQLLPGDTWKVSVPVRGVTPALRLTATISLLPLLTDSAGSVAPLAVVEGTADAWTVPWALLLLLVVVLAGLVAAALAVRRRRNGPREDVREHEDVRERGPAEQPLRERETSGQ